MEQRKTYSICIVLTLLAFLTFSAHAQTSDSSPRYTFGIVPQHSASELLREWGPILTYLSNKTGIILDFATAKDIPTFEQRAKAGQYDFVYINPYAYSVIQRYGYQAFAKERDKKLKGIIVVRHDSAYKTLRELNNMTFAFPAPTAFAAAIIPQAYLQSEGIKFTPKYVSSHESVYMAVAKGLYPAGGGVMRTFNTMPEAVRDKLRILWTTLGYTPHPFAAQHRVSQVVVDRLRAAMIAMDHDPEGKRLLSQISFVNGISAANDAEYNDVRALNIIHTDHLAK